MGTVVFSGYSDDNLEFEGAVSEEVLCYGKAHVVCDEGARFTFSYDEPGVWRATVTAGSPLVEKAPDDDDDDYTDRVTVETVGFTVTTPHDGRSYRFTTDGGVFTDEDPLVNVAEVAQRLLELGEPFSRDAVEFMLAEVRRAESDGRHR